MYMVIIQKKTIFFKYFFLLTYIVTWLFPLITFSYNFSNKQEIKKYLQYVQKKEHIINAHQQTIINNLQSTLRFIFERNNSNIKIQEYQKIINDLSYIILQLNEECNNTPNLIVNFDENFYEHDLKQKLFRINNQLTNLSKQLKQECNSIHSINNSLILLPQQEVATKNILNNLEQQKILYTTNLNILVKQAKFTTLQSEQAAKQLQTHELELNKLNLNNHKELSQLRIELLKKKYNYINHETHTPKHQLNYLYQEEKKQPIKYTKKILPENCNTLPKSIEKQSQINHDLSIILNQQTHHINSIKSKNQEIAACILQAHQTVKNLIEQTQWLDTSPVIKETLRSQVSKFPEIPKSRQLDRNVAQLRIKRLQYENQLNKIIPLSSQIKQDDGTPLTIPQKHILETQYTIQCNLITSLLNSFDTQILELTKLKAAYQQLQAALQDIQKAMHRYLFWTADFYPIPISYPLNIYQDLRKLLTSDEFNEQIISSLNRIFTARKPLIILIILCMPISIGLYFAVHHHYQTFLEQSSKKIGKVNQDHFLLTFYNIWYSMLIALPVPTLWAVIGYSFSHNWLYPISVAIQDGINATTFILWISIVSVYFASSKGLFIAHFGWSKKRVQHVFSHHYTWAVGTIVFLIMMITIFNNYNNREFSSTLGRLCFILLCVYLTFITNKLKRSGLPLYLNKYDSSDNIINHCLWNIIICAPLIAAVSCILGYLFVAQELLGRLEESLFIWIISLIIYHVIRRWTLIQQRHIAYERAKQKRTLQLTLRTHNESNFSQLLQINKLTSKDEKNRKILDLDTISTQSLQLIRSIITIIALLLMTVLWSELRSAFSFLENITLWDVTSTIKGVDNIQPITLNSFLIAVLVIVITTKTVKNLPAFLELIVLQHLDLTPGTGYTITTLTKYILMFLGGIIGCSLIGIEWTKIQWLIAALGVGLGFGLQEIFANLISGLMILVEKPIRIGDTVTINKLTGNITRINTRATIITDWNHKEIIIPNKEFITKQFINWSLSDTLTRVVLRIPAPLQTDMKEIVKFLLQIAKNSSFSLNTPPPEVYLVDLQQGLPMFEIRIHISDIKLRMPLCHQMHMLIIEYYQNNGIKLPYTPIYLHHDQLFNNFYSNYSNKNY
ncbi:miniconductance mechanosensitive channel MscM [Blochmannia endosymbiont of Camponotus sp. C-003]|uniref:miniconductance mechanosensitive channel MscM n=1 Tax=unclassified Candidatus Blochmanniella TaxID=711328 RepID=UPI00202490B4|nr:MULTISPECIES: miniconductance mechanosensitive channel MscM [unclassified Candidatus Blochmannia]URJ23159.1 miniconductance mechanosensitive channel MscM [Blochmannia endosymbiont of Camponotus sp. C-003]URJ28628.1 miniconductance mechanosensitive channel MscM [Blochmannia endosymbiont of Camponotus sp. C-046]